jgi:hypothetical protein
MAWTLRVCRMPLAVLFQLGQFLSLLLRQLRFDLIRHRKELAEQYPFRLAGLLHFAADHLWVHVRPHHQLIGLHAVDVSAHKLFSARSEPFRLRSGSTGTRVTKAHRYARGGSARTKEKEIPKPWSSYHEDGIFSHDVCS